LYVTSNGPNPVPEFGVPPVKVQFVDDIVLPEGAVAVEV
jgi:hypothetical protein